MSEEPAVLHLVNTMQWGGVRRHVLDLMDGLPRHGVRSLVAAWLPPDDALHDDPGALHLPLYEGAGARKSPSGFLVSVHRLRALLRRERICVLHMHSRYATLLGSMAAWGTNARRVYTAHNAFDDLRWLPWYPPDVIVPSIAVREHFLAAVHAAASRRLHVIAHGIALPELPPVRAQTSPRFCFAGRLREEKGVHVLYDALVLLRDEDGEAPDVDIVGDGPLLEWLRERARNAFPNGTVRVHGYSARPTDLIAGADALLFPSLRLDSVGYVNLEALALGVPVIASHLSAIAPIVVPGETGLVFPAGDAAALAGAIRWAMRERTAMRAMGVRGRELVRSRHGVDRMCAETAAVYRAMLGGG